MPQNRDFIPQNPSAFAVWFANFIAQLPVLAGKYGVPMGKITQLTNDNDWVQYWVAARETARQQETHLGDYFREIVGGELGSPAPSSPVWGLPGTLPAEVPVGIKKRVRETANLIKSLKSVYTKADGELLGIVTADEAGLNESDFTPDVKLTPMPDFGLNAEFRKFSLDAVKFEFRRKGGEWQFAGFLTKSPGVLHIAPQTAGTAEQIEIRAIFWDENRHYGNWSPIYTAVIAP